MRLQEALDKRERERQTERKQQEVAKVFKVIFFVVIIPLVLGFLVGVLVNVYRFIDSNQIYLKSPVIFQNPVEIKPREVVFFVEVQQVAKVETETTTEAKVCEAFGVENCKIAVAIMKAESGGKVGAFNSNTNGSVDIGLFQINSVHFDKVSCSLQEVATEDGNIACALSIYKTSGWSPWVAFNSGAFKQFVK